jgi:hypothetical protein
MRTLLCLLAGAGVTLAFAPQLHAQAGAATPGKSAPATPADKDKAQAAALQLAVQRYLGFNKLPEDAVLNVGMTLKEFIAILGEPTERIIDAKGDVWIRWYHNERRLHVAPVLRVRVVDEVVQEIWAGRA